MIYIIIILLSSERLIEIRARIYLYIIFNVFTGKRHVIARTMFGDSRETTVLLDDFLISDFYCFYTIQCPYIMKTTRTTLFRGSRTDENVWISHY